MLEYTGSGKLRHYDPYRWEGAGVSGIIMNRTTVDIFNPKTVRSTMGSLYRVPFYITDDLPETIEYAKSNGVSLYAAHLKGKCSYDRPRDYTGACGFMIEMRAMDYQMR